MDFSGVLGNNDPATGRGFFSLLPTMHHVNPGGLPTVFSDLNSIFPAFGANALQDSQFLINTSDVFSLPTHAEESDRLLQGAWYWNESPGESVDFAQLVLPDFHEFSYRGVVTLQLSGTVREVNVSGQLFIESPLIPINVDLGNRSRGIIIDHQFAVSSSAGDVTWGNLMVVGPGNPVLPPVLQSDGTFSWHSAGSPLGVWRFNATVTDQFGSAIGQLTLNLVPESTATILSWLGIVGLLLVDIRCQSLA